MSKQPPQKLKMYVDGKWVESESGAYFAAENPTTLATIAYVPEGKKKRSADFSTLPFALDSLKSDHQTCIKLVPLTGVGAILWHANN